MAFNATASQVRFLVRLYAKKLKLTDWNIQVEIGPPSALMDGDAATNDFDYGKKRAKIVIASDADDYIDLVDSIIHELLHLHFWWVENPTEQELLEAAFLRVARTMAELHTELYEMPE